MSGLKVLIFQYIEKYPVTSKILSWAGTMVGIYGFYWIVASWIVSGAHPDTASAHIYCSVVATTPDGKFDAIRSNEEIVISKKIAYEEGGSEGVMKAKMLIEKIGHEYADAIENGTYRSLIESYKNKCLGF